jgi:galacturonosyltransferase
MKKILVISNEHNSTYSLRRELISSLLIENKVFLVMNYGDKVDKFIEMGCIYEKVDFEARTTNIFKDTKLILTFNKIIKRIKPDIILTFTIKPNVYAGLIARFRKIPYIANITGLGTAVETKSFINKITMFLYKISMKKANCIFFQNQANCELFKNNKIIKGDYKILPGSGVNLNHFKLLPYPNDDIIRFLFIARIMKEKGIYEYLEAAEEIKKKYKNVEFIVLGEVYEEYIDLINKYVNKGIIKYPGRVDDVREFHEISHCTIHPTYYPEGMSNVLLESLACGRPIITTLRPGTEEILDDGINGFSVIAKDSKNLIQIIEKFLSLSKENKRQLGLNGRNKVEMNFNRNIVIDKYLKQIKYIIEGE